MPRDITVILERKSDIGWQLVLSMIRNDYFNSERPQENWLNSSMYINEYYPKPIYIGI
ncbi:hypothetical protein GCM10007852_00430 [Agaribacter marinus]|uniref:Uncharacterized protein n=1 Tax=Agaribacter marinus TaxID=1431249 RepID=A0AA37SW13_9ALTE|nr:hypothetical protein GCM10007852_00430 [Agaribacter marinus]